jgi:hypothetical protein
MRIDVRGQHGNRLGRVEIDEASRPLRVRPPLADRDVFLDWDGAIDDSGHLRSCIVCGHPRVYRARSLPQMTPFVVLLALGLATIALLGFATSPAFLALLAIVLVADIGVLVLARTRLVCYRCGSVYERLGIARYHQHWDSATAERDAPADAAPDVLPDLPSDVSDQPEQTS